MVFGQSGTSCSALVTAFAGPLGGGKNCFGKRDKYHHETGDDISHSLAGIFDTGNEWYTKSNNRIDPNKALNCLHNLYVTEEKKPRKAKAPRILAANVERLSKLTGLSSTDCRILEFAVLLYSDEILDETCDLLGELTIAKLFKVLSKLLELPEADVRRSLSKKGSLFRSGLLSLFKDTLKYELKILLDLISSRFADTMVSMDADPVDLLQDVIFPSSPPHLNIDDFPHKAKEIDMLLPYLKKSLNTGRRGVNILMYGDPGTGKSQLARILAKETGCELFEVASEDERGEPLTDKARLRSFHAAQALLSGRKIIILFDEIEDVFDTGNSSIFANMFGLENKDRNPKAWLNRRLGENGRAVNGWSNSFNPSQLNTPQERDGVSMMIKESSYGKPGEDTCPMKWVTDQWKNNAGYNTVKSAFWRVIRGIVLSFNIAEQNDCWSSYLVWSNLYKIAPETGGNPGERLCSVQLGGCRTL